MNYKESREYLKELEKLGFILGLDPIKNLMEALDRPDKKMKFVHIAGTNGKGSLAAYLDNILREEGYETGLYTSPAILSYGERMRVNGNNISEDEVAKYMSQIRQCSEENNIRITAFEAETAMAILYFAEKEVDFAILEVGMGGELDATNFIDPPDLAVITKIGLDHMEYLGNTKEEIAASKAGIIKEGSSIVSYFEKDSIADVFKDKAKSVGNRVKFLDKEAVKLKDRSLEGQVFSYKNWEDLKISMLGDYQIYNASLALEGVKALIDRGYHISDGAVRRGLKKTMIAGRFQVYSRDPLMIIDGGHNPQGARALVESLKTYFGSGKQIFVYGCLKDKDYKKIIDITLPICQKYFTSTPDNPRALDAKDLKEEIERQGGQAEDFISVEEAIKAGLEEKEDDQALVIFGSLYQLEAVYKYLGGLHGDN